MTEYVKDELQKICTQNGITVSCSRPPVRGHELQSKYNILFPSDDYKWASGEIDNRFNGGVTIKLLNKMSQIMFFTILTKEDMQTFLQNQIVVDKARSTMESCITELHSRIVELERCL